jgi:hypothetical protein
MNPAAALNAAAKAMAKYVKSYGSYKNALVAYNAGPSRVGKPLYSETAGYIQKILGNSNPRGTASVMPVGKSTTKRQANTQPNSNKEAALAFIFQNSPLGGMDFASMFPEQAPPPAVTAATPYTPQSTGTGIDVGAFKFLPRGQKEPGWKYLQRLASTGGLRNDPGVAQTTGGKHMAGSDHYSGTAIDYGNARNSNAQLNAWRDFLNKNREQIGIDQVIWKAPGHYDHAHASTQR